VLIEFRSANPWGLAGRSRCVLNGKELSKTSKFFPATDLMSTKSREVLFGSQIRGAKIRADGARQHASQAVREADRAEAEAWSIRMEGRAGRRRHPRRSRNASRRGRRRKNEGRPFERRAMETEGR
jgi:hypothetical protein